MTIDDATRSLLRAREDVAAALAILLDPATQPASAEVHLLDAWKNLHRSVEGTPVTNDDEGLIQWIRGGGAPLSNAARTLAADLAEEMGRDVSVRELDGVSSRSRRALIRHARDLNRTIDHYEPSQRGQQAMRRVRLWRWVKVAALLALFAGFVIAIRGGRDVGSGPWRAHYFPTRKFEHEPVLRRDDRIDFSWGTRGPHERIPSDGFSVRWDTCMVLPEPTTVMFVLQSDDGSRLLVDGKPVADLWSGGQFRRGGGEVDLAAGAHHIRLEYFELTGLASMNLRASLNGEKPAPIPRAVLRYPGDTFDADDPCATVTP